MARHQFTYLFHLSQWIVLRCFCVCACVCSLFSMHAHSLVAVGLSVSSFLCTRLWFGWDNYLCNWLLDDGRGSCVQWRWEFTYCIPFYGTWMPKYSMCVCFPLDCHWCVLLRELLEQIIANQNHFNLILTWLKHIKCVRVCVSHIVWYEWDFGNSIPKICRLFFVVSIRVRVRMSVCQIHVNTINFNDYSVDWHGLMWTIRRLFALKNSDKCGTIQSAWWNKCV